MVCNETRSGGPMSLAITSRIVSGVVVVDVSGKLRFLEFGLGQLITIWTSIRNKGGQLILLRPTDHLQKLFHITKLDSVFNTSGEEVQAVRSARKNLTV